MGKEMAGRFDPDNCSGIEHLLAVYELRARGLSYPVIGKIVGMSRSRVFYFLNPTSCPFEMTRRAILREKERLEFAGKLPVKEQI